MSGKVEVLQASSLEAYDWPVDDPHATAQRTRARDADDANLMNDCLESATLNMPAFLKEARKQQLELHEIVLRILSHQKFQMNPMTLVREETAWLERIAWAIENSKPIDIVYPQFCVIPNAAKRYTNTGVTAGEEITVRFFQLIDAAVREVYEHGIVIHALTDAALYGSAFNTHQTEVDAYYESLTELVVEMNATDTVRIYDYAEIMRTRCHPDYQTAYYEIGHRVWRGQVEELLPDTDLDTLRKSVRASVNTRRFQLAHSDNIQLFGPEQHRNVEHPYHSTVETMTDIAFRELVTIRLACGEIDAASRLWPNALRATCHKGPKNGRWAIGMKPYPEYYGTCKLLPYHGMPLIRANSKGKRLLEIVPEVLLRARDDLVRVYWNEGDDEVWAYVQIDAERGRDAGAYIPFQGMRRGEDYPPEVYR